MDRGAFTAAAWRSSRSAATSIEARVVALRAAQGHRARVVTDAISCPSAPTSRPGRPSSATRRGCCKVARGPHNIVRRVVEFAVEHPGIDVYFGTPTEILATMAMLARFELDASDLLFCDDLDAPGGLAAARGSCRSAAELADIAAVDRAVPISERTAHRILGGESPRCDGPRAGDRRATRRRRELRTRHLPRPPRAQDPPRGPRRVSAQISRRRSTRSPNATTCICKLRAEDNGRQRRDPGPIRGREGGLSASTGIGGILA